LHKNVSSQIPGHAILFDKLALSEAEGSNLGPRYAQKTFDQDVKIDATRQFLARWGCYHPQPARAGVLK
jgi:hypothetical protein